MAVIRIIPETLRAAAQRHQMVQEAINEAGTQLKNLAQQLDAAWDGGASRSAISRLESLIDDVGNIGESINGLSVLLKDVASAFESVDSASGSASQLVIGYAVDNHLLKCPGSPILRWYMFDGAMRIEPDSVRTVAYGCKTVAENLQANAVEIRQQATALGSSWEGKSYNRFMERSMEICDSFIQVAEAIEEFAASTISAADAYEAVDNAL